MRQAGCGQQDRNLILDRVREVLFPTTSKPKIGPPTLLYSQKQGVLTEGKEARG
jgi:hypothetical protein